MMPEHMKVNKAVGLTLDVCAYDLDNVYAEIRQCVKYIKESREYYDDNYLSATSARTTVMGMYTMGCTERYVGYSTCRTAVTARFAHTGANNITSHEYTNEVCVSMSTEGIPCFIHYNVSYAVVSKEQGKVYKKITISFYNDKDEMVIALKQADERSYETRSKAGKYVFDVNCIKEKEKKSVAGGCLYCDYARYIKENGIIYLACSKYDGKVAETEYDGEAYPEYCKRRV